MTLAFLIQVLIVLVVFGLVFWAIDQIPGLPPPFPAIIKVVLVLVLCIWLLRVAGVA